jgi:hypothetical protein
VTLLFEGVAELSFASVTAIAPFELCEMGATNVTDVLWQTKMSLWTNHSLHHIMYQAENEMKYLEISVFKHHSHTDVGANFQRNELFIQLLCPAKISTFELCMNI